MSRESLLDEAIIKAKECKDWQLVEWLRMARGGESAARWYTGKFAELQAENDKLVMKLNAEHIVRQNVERENAKLRELVENMAESGWVRLPVGADGEPIHIGDKTYDSKGNEQTALILELYGEEDPTWMVSMGTDACVHPSRITHERPDSLERIADEIEKADVDGCTDWADRIRKLAKEREHE